MRRRGIIFGVIGLVAVVAAISVVAYYNSTYVLTIAYTHAKDVGVVEAKSSKSAGKVGNSGETVRLFKDKTYKVTYKGDEGYASDPVEVKYQNKENQTVTIDPYYSEEKLTAMRASELDAIHAVLTETYPTTIGQYFINQGHLYHFGEWYGTTLTYNGPDLYNYDSVRLAMKKENGTWKLMSKPPMPSLTVYNTPNTPVDVLTAVNHQE